MNRREIGFGIIGGGLMGKELASAAARWCHLSDLDFVPRVAAVCDTDPEALRWFERNVSGVAVTRDYRSLLERDDVEAVYCAVPHHLHEEIYRVVVEAGRHLLGEKPFGIDRRANESILQTVGAHSDVLVRCSSEFPFYPGAQRVVRLVEQGALGAVLEVEAGFHHSSDLDPLKKINWKRMVEFNGEYGCLGDLGMHVVHLPLRFGWFPERISAVLSNVFKERPDGKGGNVRCGTWDNALLTGCVESGGDRFPLILSTKRIAPGEMNTWYVRIHATKLSVEFSTKFPKQLRTMPYEPGREQAWQVTDLGYRSAYPAITGGIFEFGFPDAILQMWAAFCDELVHGREGMKQKFHCATPEETEQSHRIFTAALESERRKTGIEP